MGSQNTVGLRLHGAGVLQQNEPSTNALTRLGGARTIRGYLEEHFLAEHASWANLEFIRHLGGRTRAYLFVDGGVLQVPQSTTNWVHALGYGFGLQARTPSGLMTIEYGLSKDDALGQGKVHVRLRNAF